MSRRIPDPIIKPIKGGRHAYTPPLDRFRFAVRGDSPQEARARFAESYRKWIVIADGPPLAAAFAEKGLGL